MKECKGCNGQKQIENLSGGYRIYYACNGEGYFPKPDYKQILIDITGTKGKTKGTLRKSPPFGARERNNIRAKRAYYVWRLARFHGGADVTMPMNAEFDIAGDPYADELDKFSGLVAEKVFGSQMAAAYRWGSVLGYVKNVPSGQPNSAYEGGRVADNNKPLEELAEMF